MSIVTLIVPLLAAFALSAIALGLAQAELRKGPELRLWTWGTCALLLGLGLLASDALLPEWFGAVLGNGLALLGLLCFAQAIYRFVIDEDAPRWLPRLALAGSVGLLLVGASPVALRTGVIAAVFAAQLLPPAVLIARRGWRTETSLRTVAAMLALTVVVLGVRAADGWAHPEGYADFRQASLGNGVTFVLCFALLLGAGFAFVLANLERAATRMRELATHDQLTGCVNRVYFDAIMNHVLERGRRERTPVSLLVMDLDQFKQVNDEHGHRTGDDVLRRFAQTVRARSRKSDVFGRLAGEEFGLILPVTDLTGALRVAEQIRAAVEDMSKHAPRGEEVSVTVSLGAATAVPRDDLSSNQLSAEADEALREAKKLGSNRVAHFGTEPEADAGLAAA